MTAPDAARPRHLDEARADQERRTRERVGAYAVAGFLLFLLFGMPLVIVLWKWAV